MILSELETREVQLGGGVAVKVGAVPVDVADAYDAARGWLGPAWMEAGAALVAGTGTVEAAQAAQRRLAETCRDIVAHGLREVGGHLLEREECQVAGEKRTRVADAQMRKLMAVDGGAWAITCARHIHAANEVGVLEALGFSSPRG